MCALARSPRRAQDDYVTKRLRRSHVVTFSALAWMPACTSASRTVTSADAAACPERNSACSVGSDDLPCTDVGGYPYSLSCLGGAWCSAYLNPPPPPRRSGECPATPPANGTPCAVAEGLVTCAYQCGSTQASVVCNQLVSRSPSWCGVVPSSCTLIDDAGTADAASLDASADGGATSD